MAAIYQWFVSGVEIQILTTTLYPLEEIEGVKFTVDYSFGYLRAIPVDSATTYSNFVSGDIRAIRIEQTVPGDEATTYSNFISGDIRPKLITVYSPDNGMEFAVDLFPANCHMTPI